MNDICSALRAPTSTLLPRAAIRLVLAISLGLLAPWGAQAQGTGSGTGGSCSPSPGGNPGGGPGTTPPSCGGPAARSSNAPAAGAGNPIHLLSGNKYQQEVDLPALPGVLGIELVRHYNSQDPHRGLTGANWRISYEAVLYDFGRQLQIVQADGRRLMFERPAAGSAVDPTGVELCTAADPADGHVRIERDAQGRMSYQWRWPDGRTLVFGQGRNGGYPLQSIAAASGEQLTLTYAPGGELASVRDPQGRNLRLAYDAKGVLTSIHTPTVELRYQRDALHRLSEVHTVAAGQVRHTRRYHYEAERQSGHAHALTGIGLVTPGQSPPVEQRLSTYAYDAQGRAVLSTKGWPKDSEQGRTEDRGIEQVQVRYVQAPLPRPGKASKTGEFIPSQVGLTTLTNSLGHTSTAKSAIVGGHYRLIEFTGAGCTSCPERNRRYTYNPRGQLVAEQLLDDGGQVLRTERRSYDAQGRLARQGALGSWNRFEYADAQTQQPSLIATPSVAAGKEHTVRIAYNAHGQPTQITEEGYSPVDAQGQAKPTPIARTTSYSYTRINGRSLLTAIDGPLPNGPKGSAEDSDITTFGWDARGSFVAAMTVPAGLRSTDERDILTGLLLRRTDANGLSTAYRYDQPHLLRPTRIERSGQATAQYAYDAQARVIQISDGPSRTIELRYDLADRLVAVIDTQGYKAQTTLDAEGRARIAALYEPQQDQPLRATYRWYDEQGRLAKQLRADGRLDTWQYDAAGQLAQHVDGDDVMRLRRHNFQGLQVQIDLASDGLMRAALSAPQPAPNASLNATEPTTRHDDFGREVLSWRPEQGLTTRVFNAGDRVIAQYQLDRAGQTAGRTTSRYDAANRLLERCTLDAKDQLAQTERWQYRGALLVRHGNDVQDTEYGHDNAGRITRTTITLKDKQGRTAYTTTLQTAYDTLGQPAAKTLADGQVLRIKRQKNGVVRNITLQSAAWARWHERLGDWLPSSAAQTAQAWLPRQAIATDVAHHPYNGITGFTLGNGLRTDKHFDTAGRVTALHDGVRQTNYGYGVGPRITKLGEKTVRYNGFGQLQEQSTARVIKTALAGRASAVPATAPALARVELDKLGRVVNDGVNRYTFTSHGQVQTVSRQDGTSIASYRYNAQRQRVSKTLAATANHASTTTYYLWQDGRLVAEIEGSSAHEGQLSAQYLYLNEGGKSQPLAKIEAEQAPGNASQQPRTLFIHAEHRGQPVAMSDAQQRVVWRAQVDLWGYVDASYTQRQDAELNLRLPGQYFDAETGLHDNWHRSYDPRPGSALKGSYLSPDPLGYPDGPDAYGYVGGDPVNRIDAMGLYSEDVHFYMTFFLARLAGIGYDEALTIALATQFVDDNRATQPIPTSAMAVASTSPVQDHNNRLRLYHFMDGLINSSGFANPSSFQLSNLLGASARAPSRCARAQFFGEYLHAFEDTFSHRAQNDAVIGINIGPVRWGVITINGVGRGHLEWGTSPDRTFNHVVTTPDDPRFVQQAGNWTSNEARTLRMEQEVFNQLATYSGVAWLNPATGRGIVDSSTGRAVTQSDLFGNGTATSGGFMQQWNRMRNDSDKIFFLNDLLVRFSLGALPTYSASEAARNRNTYLCGLNPAHYPGTILPSRSSPQGPCS
jgi:RHS repeat-associated protein